MLGHLAEILRGAGDRQRVVAHELRQVGTLDILHGVIVLVGVDADFVDRHYAGMVQVGGGLGFGLKALDLGLVGELAKVVKIIKTGELTLAVKLTGIGATAGAKAAVEAAGGSFA